MSGSGISLGKLFGIEIRIDWSWILIFLLVTWDLASALPQFNAAWSTGFVWTLGVIGALLFFLSVLIHELAHSLVSKAKGLNVTTITLFLFGGVSNIQREPPSAGAEFQITIVGPLTSIMLGIVFYLIARVSYSQISHPVSGLAGVSALTAVSVWLGFINILLGIFNLIPAFPMDGGRVLRSAIWAATDNLRVATRWAASVGQGIGWLFIVVGVFLAFGASIPFFGTGLIAGLWLVFIGWFIQSAAQASYQQLVVHDILQGVPVTQLMRTDVPTVPEDATVADLVHDQMMRTDERAFPVMRGDRLVGLVSLGDVRKVPQERWETTTVGAIMTPQNQLLVATPQEDASEAFEALATKDVNQLPVVSNDRLVGIIRRRDILRWLQIHKETARG